MKTFERDIFQKTGIARESIYLRTIVRKLTLNLIVIFNSFIDIYFLKYVTKIFWISYYFQEKTWQSFKVQLSVAVSMYILSSKRANRLQVLYIRTLGNIQGNLLDGNLFWWSCDPQIYSQHFFFWKFAEVLGQHLKSLFWKIMC